MKHVTRKNSDLLNSMFEDCDALVRQLSSPEAQQMASSDVEALILKEGSALLDKLREEYIARLPSKEKDASL